MNVTQTLQLSRPRLAVLSAFFINGALMATWVSRIPAIQIKLGLSEAALGLVLLGISVGVLPALSVAGGVIGRVGSRRVTIGAALAMCLILPLLAILPDARLLWVALFGFGASMSMMDVAMNDQAVQVERREQRPLMSSFHAAFSLGALVGALIGAAMAANAAITPTIHFGLMAVLFGGGILLASRHLLNVESESEEPQGVFSLPPRALWPLGAVAFCCALGEGAMADWSGVYLTQELGTSAAFAALGFAAFSLTMTAGRLMGDYLSTNWAPERVVRLGGVVATIGFLASVITAEPVIVLIGFAAIGIGLANIIPLAFSAAGNFPGLPSGVGIAGVATIGYAGFLAGPPVIGFLAEQTSLRIAFLLITLLVGSLIFTAKSVRIGD